MGNNSSAVAESVTGTKRKESLSPEAAGALGADWQQLAAKAKRAEIDMREAAEGAPTASAGCGIQDAVKDILEASQRAHQKTDSRGHKQAKVSRIVTSQRSSSNSHNEIGMEF